MEKNNTEGENKPAEKGAEPVSTNTTQPSSTDTPANPTPSSVEPAKPFPPPKVLEAIVDPKIKQKEGSVPFSFTTPQAIHAKQAEPTKGDVAKTEELKSKPTLAELDASIAADEKNNKQHIYDDYYDTAEMFIEGWEAILTFASRMISKDTSDSAYEFGKEKKEKLILQATKVSRKRNWVIGIEYLFLGTLIPATGAILLKASDKRKEYNKKAENASSSGEGPEVNKGGRNKGFEKRRGPGRPSKS